MLSVGLIDFSPSSIGTFSGKKIRIENNPVKIVRPQETSNRNLTFGSVVMAATKMLTNFFAV
jgi:hypothetical protein